jgi:5-methylcytosine-specific restriction endonuclease McrA
MKGKEWTPARLKAFIVSGLRACSRRYPPKFETLAEAKTEKKINRKTKRLAQHYKCNACKGDFPSTEVQVDHIIPVIDPLTGFVDWNTYIERMFCEKSNLQVLCKDCHSIKTKEEKHCSLTKPSKPKKARSSSKANSKKKN